MFNWLYGLTRFQLFLLWLAIATLAISAQLYFNGPKAHWSFWALL